jgi:hypothetical protein
MHVELIAPFRTLFNLNTDIAETHLNAAVRVLDATATQYAAETGERTFTPLQPTPSGFRKFTTLSADNRTTFSMPALCIAFDGTRLADLTQRAIARASETLGEQFVLAPTIPLSLEVHIYDNTVGILRASVGITDPAGYLKVPRASLDQALTEIASQVAREVNGTMVPRLLRILSSRQKDRRAWPHGEALIELGREFLAYDDVAFGGYPNWPKERDPLLWTNRTLSVGADERQLLPAILEWAHVAPDTARELLAQEGFCTTQVGTSIFFNRSDVEDFLLANEHQQYYFALFDILNDSLKRAYGRLSSDMDSRSFNAEIARSAHSSAFIDFVINEFRDSLLGLQAARRRFAHELSRQFDMHELIDNLTLRKQGVRDKLEKLVLQRDRLRHRGMEAALIAIGGVTLVDLGLNLIVAAKTQGTALADVIAGPLDLAAALSPDGMLWGLILFVLGFSGLYAYRRR